MCRHTPKAKQGQPCHRSGSWLWLAILAVVAMPWFWSCDRVSSKVDRDRGRRFKIEQQARDQAAQTLRAVRGRLEELRAEGKLSAAEYEIELQRAQESLLGALQDISNDVNAAVQTANTEARKAAEEVTRIFTADRPPTPPKPPATPRVPPVPRVSGSAAIVSSEQRNNVTTWKIQLDKDDDPGFSSDPERAKANVMAKASRIVADWVRSKSVTPVANTFKVSLDFMRRENMIVSGPTAVEVDGFLAAQPGAGNVASAGDTIYGAEVELQATFSTTRALIEAGYRAATDFRLDAAWERQRVGLKIVAVISAALFAVVAFFGLDDRTRGFYTKPLGAVLAAIVAAFTLVLARM